MNKMKESPMEQKVDLGFQSCSQWLWMGITSGQAHRGGHLRWRKSSLEAIMWCEDYRTGKREQLNANSHHMLVHSHCHLKSTYWNSKMCHSYWDCALEPASHNYWVHISRSCVPQHEKPCSEKPMHHKEEQPLLSANRESLHAAT